MTGMNTINAWFAQQLQARPYSEFNYPFLTRQDAPGGSLLGFEYYIDDWGTGETNWNG